MAHQKLTNRVGALESRTATGPRRVCRIILQPGDDKPAALSRLHAQNLGMTANDYIVIRQIAEPGQRAA